MYSTPSGQTLGIRKAIIARGAKQSSTKASNSQRADGSRRRSA